MAHDAVPSSVAPLEVMDAPKEAADARSRRSSFGARRVERDGASDAAREARLLSQLLQLFSHKRHVRDGDDDRYDDVDSAVDALASATRSLFSLEDAEPRVARSPLFRAASSPSSVLPFRLSSSSNDERVATALLRTRPSERELVQQFLLLSTASQQKVAQSLFVIPPSLIDNFASVLQFFVRVLIEAHSNSAVHQYQDAVDATTALEADEDLAVLQEKTCSWARTGQVSCVEIHEVEEAADNAASGTARVEITLPEGFHECLVAIYGSVERNKCEEVWHGDHMAYRCRTCGLSDSSCMCLACFDPADHEGHDYRVYRCSSGGCCDCGDPLAWRPEGFCKKHRAAMADDADDDDRILMSELEHTVVRGLIRRVLAFCANVMREVYLYCLRSGSSDVAVATNLRELPRTGRRRTSFPSIIQVHLERVEQSLAWLQTIATSCLQYRQVLTELLFEALPSDFHLDPPSTVDDSSSEVMPPLLVLDVFLKAGVLLPVEICDTLGVLYLKLLFEHGFKERYTGHFVDWYPYFIALYLQSSEENNEEGMRNLSRFIDRLFCQLFHSTAQLDALEAKFEARRIRMQQIQDEQEKVTEGVVTQSLLAFRRYGALRAPVDRTSSLTCVEWLMMFLLERLHSLFESALRVESVKCRSMTSSSTGSAENTYYESSLLLPIQVVDCGRSVFRKRVYARLCSDLRTLLVHPRVAADVLLRSFEPVSAPTQPLEVREHSVYRLLLRTFEVLQQMDLQQRHVHQHIEFESQSWTFAFVVDYEMNLLLNAFVGGIPLCFEKDVFHHTMKVEMDDQSDVDSWWLARGMLQPLEDILLTWTARVNGHPDDLSGKNLDAVRLYERGVMTTEGPMKKSFHLPLHHMLATFIQGVASVVRPQTVAHWQRLLLPSQEATDLLRLAYAFVDHPLRVSMFTREIKSGLWVRNGNAMWQQLVHYDAKHWRATGLHNDLFLTQLGALLLSANGPGQLTRFLLTQFPVRNAQVLALTVQGDDLYDDEGCTLGQQMELLEETLRLVMQLVQSPVRLALCAEPVESATFLLEREMMHWLSLGPLTRSEVLVHLDMKLVEHVRQLDAHPWHLLEEEEIVTQVLERVGEYDDPTGGPNAANATLMSFGMKMSGTWKLQRDLWTDISPLFEGFSPAEAQQCEQNVKKQLQLISSREQQKDSAIDTKSLALPLPRSEFQAPMAKTLASQLLNAPSLLAVLWIVLQNHYAQGSDGGKKQVDDEDDDDEDDTPRVTTENLVVAALSCLYMGVNLIEDASTSEEADETTKDNCLPRPMVEWERVEQVMEATTAFLSRLCVEIETRDATKVSVLSMLNEWITKPSALSGDTITLCREIVRVAEEKSEDCRAHVAMWRQHRADEAANAAIASAAASSSTASNATDRQQQAKEMMRRRQQAILERMRSQQQQFLSSQSLDIGDSANESESKEGKDEDEAMDDDDDDDDTGDVTDHDDDDDEDDEWGFPTGQLDLQLYLGHLSSAIALACERDRREQQRKRRLQQRKRRVPRTASGGSESNGSLWSRSSSSSVEMENCEDEESDDASPECALCRLACEPNAHDATYGYVSMIQPTCLPTKAGLTSSSLLRVRENDHTMGDAVIWTCGHVVHHSCIKSYIESLWKQRNSNRNPLEALHAHGDDRVLSEREREFLCPVCRRLSNCLVPHVDGSTTESTVIEQAHAPDTVSSSFLRWLKAEMHVGGLRDRRRRGTLDVLLQDQAKRRIHRFVRDIRLRSLRASLQLPLLLADGAEDEASSETEVQRVVDEWSASSASYEVLLRSFEVEVDVAIHERALLGASTLERHRFQSLRILADVVVSAAAIMDDDEAKKPKLSDANEVVTNVLFGRRVLFAEDDEDRRRSRLDVPLLSSSRLFAVFLTRLTSLLAQNPTTEARYDETVISEVYYLSRVLVAAQILQALCLFRRLDQAQVGDESVASPRPPKAKRDSVISDFGDVETLADAEEWTAQLMMRSRFVASTTTLRHASTNQLETFIAKQCLPLLRRLVLTLEVFFPRVVNHDVAHATSDEPCAVCDEIFSTVAVKSTPTPEHTEVLHHLRRLHLPPLRVFFSRHVFAPSQRELCQLWAAQVESSAAVRRQRQLPGPYSLGIFTSDAPVEDVADGARAKSLIINLPRVYMDLFIKYNDKPSGCCQRCNQIPQHPAICLFCGDVLCCFSTCCESTRGRIGECTQHAQSCGLGTGAFLLLRACTVILFLGNERRCVWGSLYVDKNGEEDPYLRRGKTLFLAPSRLQALETLLLSHSFTQNTAILANTSRRDGRRY
ncbi:hypothetical protein Poli38472_014471 [Pythium oligandrum]|uniref:E3 ubiquitin-protein ligase n=1 Tax=Pythium oligandrum TaxID=41045 RepID=A0A8K1CDX8_PYTOL|nr:hypothetical protein Poli38472_014471 [Pythium oligandrum]|eukprot:TMW61010.1 hypothetical protein Poli38472_014471 [Pythium oligandrum]